MAAIAISFNPGFLEAAFDEQPGSLFVQVPQFLLVALFGAALINLIPDYLSLLETRLVLHYLSKTRSRFATLVSLVTDAIITFAIFIVWALVIGYLTGNWNDDVLSFEGDDLRALWCVIRMPLGACAGDQDSIFLAIYLYTTFITSLWIWLHLAAGAAARVSIGITLSRKFLGRYFDLEVRPLSVMAVALSAFATAMIWPIYAVYALIF